MIWILHDYGCQPWFCHQEHWISPMNIHLPREEEDHTRGDSRVSMKSEYPRLATFNWFAIKAKSTKFNFTLIRMVDLPFIQIQWKVYWCLWFSFCFFPLFCFCPHKNLMELNESHCGMRLQLDHVLEWSIRSTSEFSRRMRNCAMHSFCGSELKNMLSAA